AKFFLRAAKAVRCSVIWLACLPLWFASAAHAQYAGPVSAAGLKNSASVTWDGSSISADGYMAIGTAGKNVWISNVTLANDTTVYWSPTTVGLSLDDRTVSGGEMMSYRNSSTNVS